LTTKFRSMYKKTVLHVTYFSYRYIIIIKIIIIIVEVEICRRGEEMIRWHKQPSSHFYSIFNIRDYDRFRHSTYRPRALAYYTVVVVG
jgi:hypothetical protein